MLSSFRSSTLVRALKVERNSRICFSTSAPVLKRRSTAKSNESFEDLFAEEDDLFSSAKKKNDAKSSLAPSSSKSTPATRSSRAPSELFEEQYTFVSARIGQSPSVTHPQVRSNAIRRLLHHSSNAAQLERLTELLVGWRNGGKTVDQDTVMEFIDRCVKWNPKLLIEVFSNRQRYGLDIPNIREARRMLRRVVFAPGRSSGSEALQQTVALAALYPSYGLPTATSDLTTCVLLAQACCRGVPFAEPQTKDALASLMPSLLKALSKEKIAPKLPDELKRLGKGDEAHSVASKRESGFSQTDAVEWKWVNLGVQDILTSLKKYWPENAEKYSKPLNGLLASRLNHSAA